MLQCYILLNGGQGQISMTVDNKVILYCTLCCHVDIVLCNVAVSTQATARNDAWFFLVLILCHWSWCTTASTFSLFSCCEQLRCFRGAWGTKVFDNQHHSQEWNNWQCEEYFISSVYWVTFCHFLTAVESTYSTVIKNSLHFLFMLVYTFRFTTLQMFLLFRKDFTYKKHMISL